MAQETKIIGVTEDGKFIIDLKDERKSAKGNPVTERVKIAHDYVEIFGSSMFQIDDNAGYKSKVGATNWVPARASIQISIRDFKDIILPLLNSHPFLQDEHFKPRQYDSDDKYFKRYDLDEPRWLKGDAYPAYAHNAGVIQYNDLKSGKMMVAFRRNGSDVWEHLTLFSFKLIEDHLTLYYTQEEMDMRKKEIASD